MRIAKRIVFCSLLAAFPLGATADPAQEDMVRVIAKLDLERGRGQAYARCVHDAPAVREWLQDPVIEQYCVLRHGAPHKIAVFLGVQLSAELERAGRVRQANVVDALLEVQAGEWGAKAAPIRTGAR